MTSIALVVAQFAALAVLVLPWRAGSFSPWGAVPIVVGAALGAWALVPMRRSRFSVLPEPARDATLVVDGPYAYLRHPMYAAVILVGAGLLLGWRTGVHAVALLVLVGVLLAKLRREERLLAARFPAYAAYAARTPRLVPRIRARPGRENGTR